MEWNNGTWEIVGVGGDVRHRALSGPLDADVYVPRRQVVRGNTWLLLASSRPAASVLAELQDRVRTIEGDSALTDAKTMATRLAESAAPARFRALVTGTLAGLTLLLAIAACTVSCRTPSRSAHGSSASASPSVSALLQ